MELANLEKIFGALTAAEVRYLIVGGLAVITYGYLRTTDDIDLVIALEPDNVRRATSALGYRPKVPVDVAEPGNPAARKRWIDEKGMVVFQLFSDRFPHEPIDVFVAEPFDFAREHERCEWRRMNSELSVPFLNLEQLLAMKRAAGRPQDIADVAELLRNDNETRKEQS